MDIDASTSMLGTPPPQKSQKLKQYIATTSVSIGALCAGTVLSWTSPALGHIMVSNDTNSTTPQTTTTSPGFTITQTEGALVGSMLTFGALVSALPTGYLADKIGRKATILGLAALFLLNWILIIFSSNVEMVIAARFFGGMGLGGVCVVAPIYICEIAEPSHRGIFGSFFQLFLSLGILLSCVVGYFTNWLGLGLVLAITPIVFGGSFLFMPETPVYLMERNKLKKAEENLRRLRGSFYDVSSELREMENNVIASRKNTATLRDVIYKKGNLRAIISVLGVLAFQQLCGINAITFYTVSIFKAAGTTVSPFLAAIIINLVQVIVSYISILIIEKANRKFYLIISSAGMFLSLTALGMFFHLKLLQVDISHLGFVPLANTILFMISFSLGYGPVPWMLMGELLSPEIKGIASGMGVLTNWIFAFVVTYSFPIMNASLGTHITFYVIAGGMALATAFVYFVVPETRGKSLAEIQESLRN